MKKPIFNWIKNINILQFLFLTALYLFLSCGFTLYWDNNYEKYTTYKEDDDIYMALVLICIALFYFLLSVRPKRLYNYFFLILMPLLTFLLSYGIDIILYLRIERLEIESNPRMRLGFVYSLFNFMFLLYIRSALNIAAIKEKRERRFGDQQEQL
jgi:hypothetical protein